MKFNFAIQYRRYFFKFSEVSASSFRRNKWLTGCIHKMCFSWRRWPIPNGDTKLQFLVSNLLSFSFPYHFFYSKQRIFLVRNSDFITFTYTVWDPHNFRSWVWMVKGALSTKFRCIFIKGDNLYFVIILFYKAS